MSTRRLARTGLVCCLILARSTLAAPTAADLALAGRLAERYHPRRSRVMVRHVAQPTRAALDRAAFLDNVLLQQPPVAGFKPPEPRPRAAEVTFDGALTGLVDELPGCGPDGAGPPLALAPLIQALLRWDWDRAESLLVAQSLVEMEKWGQDDQPLPLQKLTRGWLREGGELWVQVDFEPGLAPVEGLHDLDGDGRVEGFGRLAAPLSPPVIEQIEQYVRQPLSPAEVDKYFEEVVAKWYPTLKTVLLPPAERRPWPSAETEPEIRRELGEAAFAEPTVVIRGEPDEAPLYNVFLLGEARAAAGAVRLVAAAPDPRRTLSERIRGELAAAGGSWAAWEARLKDFREDVAAQLRVIPEAIKGLPGRDGFCFFRGSLEYLLAGDLTAQPEGQNPFPAIVDYQQALAAKGIDLLLVIIPTKPEIMPRQLSDQVEGELPVQPYVRKLMLELSEAGVECVDLYPALRQAAAAAAEPFYLPSDTHWSPAAGELAARLIAERIKQYPWFAATGRQLAYTTRPAEFTRTGDIVDLLRPADKLKYRPLKLTANQVVGPDGRLYEDDPTSPLVLLGDSFCAVYQVEDCQHAGLPAHLAKELGTPLDLLMARGSGPTIRVRLARRGAEALRQKKLVVWTVVARDLYHYWAPWAKVPVP